MAIPTYLVGTGNGGVAASEPFAITPPTHQADDWLYLPAESGSTNIIVVSPGAGAETWTQQASSPQVSAGALATRLTAYRHKAAGAAVSSPTISNLTNHGWGVILRVRGADTTEPLVASAGGVQSTATTSIVAGGVDTTGVADCLILTIISWGVDSAGPLMSGGANADLANFTEVYDLGTTAGNGGGLVIFAGEKAVGGVIGNTTATAGISTEYAWITFALKPPAAAGGDLLLRLMGENLFTGMAA